MKVWKYIVTPLVAFAVGLILFSRLISQGETVQTAEIPEATLPIVYMTLDGEPINALHPYTGEMDAASTGVTVTPVEEGGVLSIRIEPYGNEITGVRYEVRSLDADRLVQQSEAEVLPVSGDEMAVDLPIRNLLTEQTEYLLTLEVTASGRTCYFYTRIIEESTSSIAESISFVWEFHEITMSKTRQSELTVYMETTKGGANNKTLQTVTLRNSLSQMCWGDLRGTEATEPELSVLRIGDDYNELLLSYILTATDEEGNQDSYSVEEYYRVRRGEDRMYLLAYERTVEEIYSGEIGELPSKELNLGIRSADVEYGVNETGTVVCFVQSGELWSYDMDSGYLTRIFSFRSSDEIDLREIWDAHDIRIIRVSENGSVDFAVCGYMNSGEREGQVGISVCHFDSVTTTVEERVFLPSSQPYTTLREEVGQAMYLTDSGQFCFVMGDRIYSVDPERKDSSVLIFGVTGETSVCSEDGRYLAWTEEEDSGEEMIRLIDLETGETGGIHAPEGWRIRPLGFMDSDFVYGLAKESDILPDSDVFPMSSVLVVSFADPDLPVLKTYDSEDAFVTGVEVREGNLYLERMTLEDGEYVEAEEDVIYNREMQDGSPVSVVERYSDVKETEVALQLPQTILFEPELQETQWIFSDGTELRLSEE